MAFLSGLFGDEAPNVVRVTKAPTSTFERRNIVVEPSDVVDPVITQEGAIYIALDASDSMRLNASGDDVWDAGNPEASRWHIQITNLIVVMRAVQGAVAASEVAGTPIRNDIAIVTFPTQQGLPFALYESVTSSGYDDIVSYLEDIITRRPAFRGGSATVIENLSNWTPDGSTGNWVLSNNNNTGLQTVNSPQPTFLVRPGAEIYGETFLTTISVQTNADDDFIGVALGYSVGDDANENADYLVVTWKQADQGAGVAGLALVRVTGRVDTGDHNNNPLWNFPANQGVPGFPVEELQRGINFGNIGWEDFVAYNFRVEYSSGNIKVFVDEVLELDYSPPAGTLPNGPFAFFGLSQANVQYESNQSSAFYSSGNPFNEAFATLEGTFSAEGFFNNTSLTNKAVLFYTGGEPDPLSSVDVAESQVAQLGAVPVFGFNSLFPDTTQTQRIDTTPQDGVPVLTSETALSLGSFTTVISPVTYRIPATPLDPVRDFPTTAIVTRITLYNPTSSNVDVTLRYNQPFIIPVPAVSNLLTLAPNEFVSLELEGDNVRAFEILQATCNIGGQFEVSVAYVQITQETVE